MRTLAIHAVEFEFVVDRWPGEEALERGDAHVLNILEGHVVFHPHDRRLRFRVRKPQPREDFFRHRGADRFVAVEPNAASLIDKESRWLADVMEQNRKHERRGNLLGKQRKHEARVNKDIALGVEVGWLFATFQRLDLGEQDGEQTGLIEQIESANARGVGENFDEFIADALGAHGSDLRRSLHQGPPGFGFDLESQRGREPHAADEPQLVLGEARMGIADAAEDACAEVRLAADEVEDLAGEGIEEQAVHCEIPPSCVALGVREGNRLRVATIAIRAVRAEGGDLKFPAVFQHDDHTKLRPDRHRAWEELLDFLRTCARGDVDVVGLLSEKPVANTAARKKSLVARRAQAFDQPRGGGFH